MACEVTRKHVLPSQCARCSVTNKIALKTLLVLSSVSQMPVLASIAVKSSSSKFCLPNECQNCSWTGNRFHPEDIRICKLTGLTIHQEFLTEDRSYLRPLFDLLNDLQSSPDGKKYPLLEGAVSRKLKGLKCRIVSGAISPTKNTWAVCAVSKSVMGFKIDHLGFVLSPQTKEIIGQIAQGKRTRNGWVGRST